MRMRKLCVEAVRQSNLPLRQKFVLRLALVNPNIVDAVTDFIVERAALNSVQDFDTMADGQIIELIIKYLPEILELIKQLIDLFG